MSDEIVSTNPEEAFETDREIRFLISNITKYAFHIGERLHRIITHKEDLTTLGYKTALAYFSSLGLKKHTAYRFVKLDKLRQTVICKLPAEVQDIVYNTNYSKILAIAKKIEDNENQEEVIEWIHKAHTLSRCDLFQELKEVDAPKKDYLEFRLRAMVTKSFMKHFEANVRFNVYDWPHNMSYEAFWNLAKGKEVAMILRIPKDVINP